MPSGEQVADKARGYSEHATYWGVGYCLKFSRNCAGAPAAAHDAITAWREADHRHSSGGTPPRGAMVFWSGGSAGHGHIAVSDGGGYVWSTDILRPGKVDRVSLAYLGAKWGNLHLLGWAEDVNGIRISGLEPVIADLVPTVHLANLKRGVTHADVRELQLALRRHGTGSLNPSGATGHFGSETEAMTRAFQQKQGWSGSDADGVPGPKTCALLGLHVI